jgi:thermostable 8-oxoguanine DNA glycosylase
LLKLFNQLISFDFKIAKTKSMKHKTIFNIKINLNEYEYNYQNELTSKLDNLTGNFNQDIINEIVLWKVNRYSLINKNTFSYLNKIRKTDRKIDEELTKKILEKLLATKGIRLPIASSILRFKNPSIYQIIDQRVYRLINNHELKLPYSIKNQIELYLNYLTQLRDICKNKNIPFKKADRILYEIDKILNKDIKLKSYG